MPHTLVISSHHPQPRSLEFLTDWHDTCRRCCEVGQYNTYMVYSSIAHLKAHERLEDVLDWPRGIALYRDQTQVAFNQNHGHLLGFMHALLSGLRTAWRNGFGWIVLLESDVLCRVDFTSVLEYMYERDIRAMAPRCKIHNGMLETGLMFFSISDGQLVDDFADAMYGNYQKLAQEQITCEEVIEKALGDRLRVLNWAGDRDEHEQVDLEKAVYLTHSREGRRRIFKAQPVLKMNQETGELEDDTVRAGISDLCRLPPKGEEGAGDRGDSEGAEIGCDDGVFA